MNRKQKPPPPKIMEVDQKQLDELLEHAEAGQTLSQQECQLLRATFAARRYLYRARLRGGPMERITPADAHAIHSYDVSPNGRWAVHTASRMEAPPATALVELPAHRVKHALIDNEPLRLKFEPLLARPAEFFNVTIPGGHVLDGWMLKPPAFDPAKKYPVLVYVYGEPAGQTVLDRWGDEGTLFHRYIAEQGYIVLSIDNRGTPAPKGSAWRHAIYGAIGVLAADEQAAALRALAAGRSYLDLDRVAVWGWSGGGSMTLHLVFRYPELYKVGMSVAAYRISVTTTPSIRNGTWGRRRGIPTDTRVDPPSPMPKGSLESC